MPNTIADIIKESSENALNEVVGSPINSGLTLYDQAKKLLASDERDFQRLGTNFLVPNDSLNVKFNKFLAELLLREGGLLLDRCLQQRKEYQELHAKWFEACVQIDEMFRLSELTDEEAKQIGLIQDGVLNAEIEISKNQSKYANDNISRLNSKLSTWDDESANLQTLIYRATKSNLATNQLIDGPMGFTPGDSSHGWVIEGAKKTAEIQRNSDKLQLVIQNTQHSSIKQSADDTKTKTEKEIDLKNKLLEYKTKRNEVARLVATRRANQLTKVNGALNFNEQMKPIKERFRNDLISAYLRLLAANEGFQTFYGAKFPIKFSVELSDVESADLEKPELIDEFEQPEIDDFAGKIDFDDLVTWTQKTNTWLAAFLDEQQLVTRSFSLRNLIEEEGLEWTAEGGSWSFKLTESHFPDMQFVRLRSFAVQIDSEKEAGSWNISIILPAEAKIRQKEGLKNLEQGHIGKLYLGRVNERTYAVIPESAAPPKLYNASPIGEDSDSGKWTISVIGNGSTSGAEIENIQDIDIHLTVALV